MTQTSFPSFTGLRAPQERRQRFCLHCERVTAWHDDFGVGRCMTCDREAAPPPAEAPSTPDAHQPVRPPARSLAHTRRFLRRYPRVLLIAVLLVASFALAAWLDTRATASAATESAAPSDTTTAVSSRNAAHAAALDTRAPAPADVLTMH